MSNVKYECEKNDIHEMIMAYACEDKYMQTWVGEAEQQLQEAGIKLCKVAGGLETGAGSGRNEPFKKYCSCRKAFQCPL